jgi:hypothetical protein
MRYYHVPDPANSLENDLTMMFSLERTHAFLQSTQHPHALDGQTIYELWQVDLHPRTHFTLWRARSNTSQLVHCIQVRSLGPGSFLRLGREDYYLLVEGVALAGIFSAELYPDLYPDNDVRFHFINERTNALNIAWRRSI